VRGSQLRPNLVWFGEAVPAIEEAIAITEKASSMIANENIFFIPDDF
jgi:NAD-dependent deacetylase